MGREYVFIEDRDGVAKIVEGHKYVNTADRSLAVKNVTQHTRHVNFITAGTKRRSQVTGHRSQVAGHRS